MGESIVRSLDPKTGTKQLAAWLDTASNKSNIGFLDRTLRPVQELRPFQRRWNDFSFDQLVTALGQTALFNFEVPEGEAWKLTWVSVLHTDPGGALRWQIVVVRAAGPTFVLTSRQVGASQQNLLYPGRQVLASAASSAEFEYGYGPLELLAGDTLSVRNQETFTAAGTADCDLRYENIPPPQQHNRPTGGTSVVV